METKKLIGGLLAGVAIGVAVGMLLAPNSGKKTLRNLARGSKRLTTGLRGSVNDSIESFKNRVNSGLDESAKRSKEAVTSASDRIKI